MRTALIIALLTVALPEAAAQEERYHGLYACTPDGEYVVGWVGETDPDFHRAVFYSVYSADDYPIEESIRSGYGGGSYSMRGGTFRSGNSTFDVDGSTVLVRDEPCGPVETLADVLGVWGLDVDALAQEVADLEGWTRDQVDARLGDADFAYAAFASGNQFGGTLRTVPLAAVVLGKTLPEPPPPPNAAPTASGIPEAADEYEGVYSDGRFLYLVRGGRFIQFTDEYDDDWTVRTQYVFEPRRYYPRAYDYQVVGGEFRSGDESEMSFVRREGTIAELVWRNQTLPRVYTLRQLAEAAGWEPEWIADDLAERGMAEADIEAVLDDAARFADVVREGNAPITLGKLAGLDS